MNDEGWDHAPSDSVTKFYIRTGGRFPLAEFMVERGRDLYRVVARTTGDAPALMRFSGDSIPEGFTATCLPPNLFRGLLSIEVEPEPCLFCGAQVSVGQVCTTFRLPSYRPAEWTCPVCRNELVFA